MIRNVCSFEWMLASLLVFLVLLLQCPPRLSNVDLTSSAMSRLATPNLMATVTYYVACITSHSLVPRPPFNPRRRSRVNIVRHLQSDWLIWRLSHLSGLSDHKHLALLITPLQTSLAHFQFTEIHKAESIAPASPCCTLTHTPDPLSSLEGVLSTRLTPQLSLGCYIQIHVRQCTRPFVLDHTRLTNTFRESNMSL